MNKSGTKTVLNRYQRVLQEKAKEVRVSLSTQSISDVAARLGEPLDEGDLSHQSHEEWIFLNRNSLDAALLREIHGALRRIEQGTYGVCEECQEQISPKRLDAIPWARNCVKCQERIASHDAPRAVEAD